ncbi:arrestin domain-containing protein 4-like isoform X2 [Tachypleus tridentatus]|uniref:arrestin domain-containing protein 4-like isoform X2 n=1 Tax=Tachypleus tridentatus TaxID=6853 RepID=UPI003FD35C7C
MTRKLKRFLILLDNDSLLYLPGSFLSGRVLLELEEDTPVLGLFFYIAGEGVIRFADRGQGKISDKENYIDFSMRLLGDGPSGPGARIVVLSPGVHSFPFKLGLPLGLPSTFLGKHGWVQYFCKASLKEPSGVVHKNQQVFIIMNPIDLNLEPAILMKPFLCEIEDTIGVPCLSAGPVSCRIRLDRGGYVPGECICIYASIENNSKVTIKKTRAVLTEFIIKPKGLEKELKLQLPIMIATYPVRNNDGTLSRKKGTNYPTVLPMFRPWMNTNSLKK